MTTDVSFSVKSKGYIIIYRKPSSSLESIIFISYISKIIPGRTHSKTQTYKNTKKMGV